MERSSPIYVGQVFEVDFGDGAVTSAGGGTLCSAGDSGFGATRPDRQDIETEEYAYGAVGTGTDYVALPRSGGRSAVFELSVIPAPGSGLSVAQIALRGVRLLLMVAGLFLLIENRRGGSTAQP